MWWLILSLIPIRWWGRSGLCIRSERGRWIGVINRGGGSLTAGPIINGTVVNDRVNDTFAFIFVLGGN